MRTPGDEELRRKAAAMLAGFRERVLDNARLERGETLLDVGCGEGLIGLGALQRGAGTVVFSDISRDVLDACRDAVASRGDLERCRFVQASADDLAGIANGSVDIVTTRSVLIYVRDKAAAFREFARVLRPGGRISLFEPINRFAQVPDRFGGFDLSAVSDIAAKVRAVYDAIQPPDSDPMLDFDERDLLACAEAAGFHPIRVQLDAEIRPSEPVPWEVFVDRAGNPRIPTLDEAMKQALTDGEREELVAHLQPLVEAGRGTWRMASAYLSAVKPESAGLH
jgi:SAM-dependent methyltransferase